MKLRSRIFLSMAGLSLGVAALTWILSYLLLEPFYISVKRGQLEDIARRIGEVGTLDAASYTEFASLERSTTVHISLVGKDGRFIYDSNFLPADEKGKPAPFAPTGPEAHGPRPLNDALQPRLPPLSGGLPPHQAPAPFQRNFGPLPLGNGSAPPGDGPIPQGFGQDQGAVLGLKPGSESIFERTDPRLGVSLLFLSKTMDSGDHLVLSFPIAEAAMSARAAMLFLSLSSAAALVAAAIISYFLAHGATRPFAELISLSRALASLDFSKRFIPSRQDEVAVLGSSMNELAEALQAALAELELGNARLREDVEREKKVDAMRREFISSVSHELKTPIALILGYAEGIKEGVPGDLDSRDAYLAVIIDEARKMDAQVRDLLELSQIDSGLLPLSLEDFDLREVVDETLSSFARALEERELTPGLSLEAACLRGDRDMIRRAFVNYFSNAVSHVDENRYISISITNEGPSAVLTVFNSGPLIPQASLELIWNSYYKVDPARSREFGGTGLGLAIARGIVIRHGGSCSVANMKAPPPMGGALRGSGDLTGVAFSFRLPTIASGEQTEG